MQEKTAIIVIDSGFSLDSLEGAGRVLGVCSLYDVRTAHSAKGLPAETLAAFAGDAMGHGSIVLKNIRALAPGSPLVLVRAYSPEQRLLRTTWSKGAKVSPGWTEAYLWAVELCQRLGHCTVANCSFGGFTHAMDGSGFESYQLGRAVGSGKGGHVLVAAAGPGDGRATHAALTLKSGSEAQITVQQDEPSWYNLWVGGLAGTPGVFPAPSASAVVTDWMLEVWSEDRLVQLHRGADIPPNMWNGRQQLTFFLEGSGRFYFRLRRRQEPAAEARFDVWVTSGGGASFLDHVDPTLICEPAVFPHVISAGLRAGQYSPSQALPGGKPDILLEGSGPISFRLPEVTVAAARLLNAYPRLDVDGVRALLGKYPSLVSPGS